MNLVFYIISVFCFYKQIKIDRTEIGIGLLITKGKNIYFLLMVKREIQNENAQIRQQGKRLMHSHSRSLPFPPPTNKIYYVSLEKIGFQSLQARCSRSRSKMLFQLLKLSVLLRNIRWPLSTHRASKVIAPENREGYLPQVS